MEVGYAMNTSQFSNTVSDPVMEHQTERAVVLVMLVMATPATILLNVVVLIACKRYDRSLSMIVSYYLGRS